jgi:hypothetical protein
MFDFLSAWRASESRLVSSRVFELHNPQHRPGLGKARFEKTFLLIIYYSLSFPFLSFLRLFFSSFFSVPTNQ